MNKRPGSPLDVLAPGSCLSLALIRLSPFGKGDRIEVRGFFSGMTTKRYPHPTLSLGKGEVEGGQFEPANYFFALCDLAPAITVASCVRPICRCSLPHC